MENVIDPYIAPKGSVSLTINGHFDKIGAFKVRDGLTIVGAQISVNNVLGLYQFLDEGSGTNNQLMAVVTTVLYRLSGGTWTSKLTGLTSSLKMRFTSFLDYVFITNGTDAVNTWDGSGSAFGTANAVSAPTGKFIERFKNRVWISCTATYPSRLFYSSLPSTDATPVITWSASNYIEISPGDGEDVTGQKRFDRTLYVFKENFTYPVYSKDQTEPDAIINVGTMSHESIDVAKDGMYWHHWSGIYRLRRGEGQPKEISKPVDDIIKVITLANYSNVTTWHDNDHVYFSVGTVTVNGITITACVLRWTISSEIWTVYSYPTQFLCAAQYQNGTNIVQVVGDTTGKIHTVNSGVTDNSTPINYLLETQWWDGGQRHLQKTIEKMNVVSESATGAKVSWRSERDTGNVFNKVGSVTGFNTILDNLDIRGSRLKLTVSGSSTGTPAVFSGFELLTYTTNEI